MPPGFLVSSANAAEKSATVYAPREGDLLFYDDKSPVWTALFALADTGPPVHMGIVVKKPGGGRSCRGGRNARSLSTT